MKKWEKVKKEERKGQNKGKMERKKGQIMKLGGTESNKETLEVKINMSEEGEKYNNFFFFLGGGGYCFLANM